MSSPKKRAHGLIRWDWREPKIVVWQGKVLGARPGSVRSNPDDDGVDLRGNWKAARSLGVRPRGARCLVRDVNPKGG